MGKYKYMDPHENIPWLYRLPSMEHYYGDTVRQLFLTSAVLMLVGAPFYTDDIAIQGPTAAVAAVALALIAGVMSPRMRFAKFASVLVSVGGALYFEFWALSEYQNMGAFTMLFLLRQIIALLFFFALYFSMKTTRADVLEQLVHEADSSNGETMSDLMAKADEDFAADAGDSQLDGNDSSTS